MDDTPKRQRRQRAILSCNDCRRRKLKCDRLFPCNRCIKGGISHSCAYATDADIASTAPETQSRSSKRRRTQTNRNQESSDSDYDVRRAADLTAPENLSIAAAENESLQGQELQGTTAIWMTSIPCEPKESVEFLGRSPNIKPASSNPSIMGMLKGRKYGTFFYGASSAMSIIAHFPDLRSFMKEAYSTSTARRLSQDRKASEERARALKPLYRTLRVSNLRSLLPDRQTVDILLEKYFATFETTFRIIHVPTFRHAYDEYWTGIRDEDSEMDAVVLMILACTLCTSTHESPRFNHNGSSHHSKAVIWIKACETWSRRQSNKYKTLATLQVRCLRILALATTSHKVKEYYQEVEAHIGAMRSGGMHRDPMIYGSRCSVFEGEIRRRLWATSMELELQASVEKGTSSALSSHDYDCASPRNVNDTELFEEMTELPRSHPASVFTDTSFLHQAMKSIDLRGDLCSLANSLKVSASTQTLLEHDTTIRQYLDSIPQWAEPRALPSRTLLHLQLHECHVILHTARALRIGAGMNHGSRYHAITALESAAMTLDLHVRCINTSNFALCLTRLDYFRAALLICHIAYYALERKDALLIRLTMTLFDDAMNKSLRVQEERATRPGRGMEYLWYLSAAISLISLRREPSKAEKFKHQAIDRMAKVLYKELSLLDEPSAESLASEVLLGDTRSVNTDLSSIAQPLSVESFTDAGLQLDAFDLNDSPSDFMFDNLWFFNDMPALDIGATLQPGLY